MTPDQAQDGVLTLRLELPASLAACADVSNRLHTDLRELIEQGLTTLLTQRCQLACAISLANELKSQGFSQF